MLHGSHVHWVPNVTTTGRETHWFAPCRDSHRLPESSAQFTRGVALTKWFMCSTDRSMTAGRSRSPGTTELEVFSVVQTRNSRCKALYTGLWRPIRAPQARWHARGAKSLSILMFPFRPPVLHFSVHSSRGGSRILLLVVLIFFFFFLGGGRGGGGTI